MARGYAYTCFPARKDARNRIADSVGAAQLRPGFRRRVALALSVIFGKTKDVNTRREDVDVVSPRDDRRWTIGPREIAIRFPLVLSAEFGVVRAG